jgi:DNA replication protein DnaC
LDPQFDLLTPLPAPDRPDDVRRTRGATSLTTKKSVEDWPEVLAGDEVMTSGLLDRLLHLCHVFNIKGQSCRLLELDRALK